MVPNHNGTTDVQSRAKITRAVAVLNRTSQPRFLGRCQKHVFRVLTTPESVRHGVFEVWCCCLSAIPSARRKRDGLGRRHILCMRFSTHFHWKGDQIW
jgi:hypothetical protein